MRAGIVCSLLRISFIGSILFLVQEANHAEFMEHEASLSRNAQEEKLSLQQVIQEITQVLESHLVSDQPGPPYPLSSVGCAWTWNLVGMSS